MMKYMSGNEVMIGDTVRINFERTGKVIAIIENEQSMLDGYYFREFGPGVLFNFDGWGNVFYPAEDIDNDEDLFLVKRA